MMMLSLQFTITVLVCFLYLRLSSLFSIAHKWLTGLEFCIPPSEKELEELDNPKLKKRSKKKNDVPEKKSEIELSVASISDNSLLKHLFYDEFDQMVLVLTCISVNFFFSEIWSCFIEETGSVLTAILLLAVGLSIKIMFSLLSKLGVSGYEIRLSALAYVLGFIFSFFFLDLPAVLFDFDFELRQGFIELTTNINQLFNSQNLESFSIDVSYTTFRVLISAIAALFCSSFFLSAFRYSRCTHELAKYTPRPYHAILSRATFVFPAFIMLLWVKPLSRGWLVSKGFMSDESYEIMRLWFVFSYCLLRFWLIRPYLQSYLATAIGWSELLLQDSQSKVRGPTIKYKIISIYTYICVAAAQLLAPIILLLSLALLLKTRGLPTVSIFPVCTPIFSYPSDTTSMIGNLTLATPMFYKGVFSYFTWFTIVSWFTTTVVAYWYERKQSVFK